MRRKDREVADLQEIGGILRLCKTCHVAMVDDDTPYVVPLSYGFQFLDGSLDEFHDGSLGGGVLELYFHSAFEGRKIVVLRRNSKVCFEMAHEGEPIKSEDPCGYGYNFASVIGFGEAVFLEDVDEKCEALSIIFKHQTGEDVLFNAEQAGSVCVFKVVSTEFTGKRK